MQMNEPDDAALAAEIKELRNTRNAIILAHYYQRPAVQHVADFTGDSLALCRRAVEVDAEVIVFCGVRFMAETAAILNRDKTVLLPVPAAGCSLAESATADAVRQRLRVLPEGTAVVCYVNSSAEVKAEAYACCTSANAVQVVESVPHETVLFVPDRNLASYVAEQTEKEIVAWDGRCHVHDPNISPAMVRELKRMHPDAEVMVHPECPADVRRLATFVGSTSQMLGHARESGAEAFIVATEEGLRHVLEEENPHKSFYTTGSVCASMRLITLPAVRRALDRMQHRVSVPEQVAERAQAALDRMLAS